MNEFSATDDMLAANRAAAVFSTADIASDPDLLPRLVRENPQQTVRFKQFTRVNPEDVGFDPRLRRVRNIYRLPAGIWAHWLLAQRWFQWIIFLTIALNCLLIVVESSVSHASAAQLMQVVYILSNVCSLVFCGEIIIKWIDNFRGFWLNAWNVFDFILTVASVPDLLTVLIPIDALRQPAVVAATDVTARITRALRALRVVSWFPALRTIVQTAFKALGALGYLVLLLLISMFLFAVFGLTFFEAFAEGPESRYTPHWQNLASAMLGLFQVVTYDHWYDHLREVMQLTAGWIAIPYFLLWLILGGFIFRNIFVGIMVQYFQDIKAEMARARAASRRAAEAARLQQRLGSKLAQRGRRELQNLQAAQAAALARASTATRERREAEADALRAQVLAADDAAQSGDMGRLVRLLASPSTTDRPAHWPRDALMDYLLRMSQLQENMSEQQELFRLAGVALHSMMGDDERRIAGKEKGETVAAAT